MHNAKSHGAPYAEIARAAKELGLRRLALSASPGNTEEEILTIRNNCQVDELIRIYTPVSEQITSMVWAEEADCYQHGQQRLIERLIETQIQQCTDRLNELIQSLPMWMPLMDIGPHLSFRGLQELKAVIDSFPDNSNGKYCRSLFEEAMCWLRIYNRATAQSFEALRAYVSLVLSRNTKYAARMRNNSNLRKLLEFSETAMHPKLEQLGKVALSLMRRGKQFIDFVDNKHTAQADVDHLIKLGLNIGKMLGGGSMTLKQQEPVFGEIRKS
jgi:ERCC4-related helicase